MNQEFEIKEQHLTFDFKSFFFKILSYWPLFITCLAITFGIAYFINIRKLPVYKLDTLISIKDDQNPFFTTNTSLTFNWGGTTDKVNTSVITLKSRSHNEKVVDRLHYYINYYKDGKYNKINAYKKVPFIVQPDSIKFQSLHQFIKIEFVDSVSFLFSVNFEGERLYQQNFNTKEKRSIPYNQQVFKEKYQLGKPISNPFFNGMIVLYPQVKTSKKVPYYFSFSNFDTTVKHYSNISVRPESTGSSILRLSLIGKNKANLVDYLNTSVKVLSEDMLTRKNLFATKTIKFIDSSLTDKSKELVGVEDELNLFKDKNAVFDLEIEGRDLNAKLNALDIEKDAAKREINYYNELESYLIQRSDYRNIPAPSVAGITEKSIISSVSKIINLAEQRNKLQYSYKEGAPVFADIDRQIDAVKRVLLENISSSKKLKNFELNRIQNKIYGFENDIKKLPKEQQELLNIQRRYNLSQATYNLFLSKSSEARLVKAANVSDVMVIDTAKDTGGNQIGPNTQLNYLLALILGLLIPFLFVFIKSFFNTKITNLKEISSISSIPVLGVIGKIKIDNNLAVLNKPKSSVSEAFRGIRSSLQFMYKKQGVSGAKTVLITSSVSGEGKTFCSINIASVFALSNKKAIIVGLDLRKPKIFGDFNIDNTFGVVNYLIDDAEISDIIQKTKMENLNVITSGPIPPNPSELLMSERMEDLINNLKKEYDYIILDSPPLGLVSDALELTKFADATIYMVRQNYTTKGMFTLINDKYKTGEIKNVSFVLNFFEEKAHYGYGYGYGYGAYGNGYHENEVKKSIFFRIKNIFKN